MTDETADLPQPSELLRVWQERPDGTAPVVVHAVGEIDLASATKVDDLFDQIEARPPVPRCVVLDLTGVTFLSSAGLSLLIKTDRRMRDAGAGLYVVAGNRLVTRAITRTGLADVLTLFATLDEAVAAAP